MPQLFLPQPLLPEQRDVLDALRRLWADYSPLVRERENELAGGMQFRTVDGAQYLTRYRPDPDARGRKLVKNLGRRSPDTEVVHETFLSRRAEVDARIAELEPRVTSLARALAGMRVARMGASEAEQIRRLAKGGFLDPARPALLPLGQPALATYEMTSGLLAPQNVLWEYGGDDATLLYAPGRARIDQQFADKVAHALFTKRAKVVVDVGDLSAVVYTADTRGQLFRQVEIMGREALREALHRRDADRETRLEVGRALERLPTVRAMVPAHDGSIQDCLAPDPRGYVLAYRLLASVSTRPADDHTAFRRAHYAAWLIRDGQLGEAFTDAQEGALARLGYPNPLLGFDPSFDPETGRYVGPKFAGSGGEFADHHHEEEEEDAEADAPRI